MAPPVRVTVTPDRPEPFNVIVPEIEWVAGAKAFVVAVKFLPVTFALLTVTEALEAVKVYPVKLGVTL